MAESQSKPNLNDYRSMMHKTHAPARLQSSVLEQAGQVRANRESGSSPAVSAQVRRPRHSDPTTHPSASSGKIGSVAASSSLSAAARRKTFRPVAALAACLAFAFILLAAGSAIGWPGGVELGSGSAGSASGNSFVLAAYAAENPEGTAGKTVLLNSSEFRGGGGSSGPWYNPADQTFWNYPWVGYKYHFFLTCAGNNIESITYEVEGERSYFEVLDNKLTTQPRQEGEHAFNYTKTVTFDYNNQQSMTDERTVMLYLGYPLSDAGMQALDELYAGNKSDEVHKQFVTAHEAGAAKEMANSRLKLTATFSDGSTQTKTFVIKPIDNFDEVYSAFWDARSAQTTTAYPEMPKLYTITELPI